MPTIEITSPEQYRRAIDVLIQTGGTFQGRGRDKQVLMVTDAQYKALVEARVVRKARTKAQRRGKKTRSAQEV